MPTSTEWPIFLAAAIAYAAVPGPAMCYVALRSLRGGRREGTFSALGNGAGTALHALAAALGVSAVLAGSPSAATALKLAGAAYLSYLGAQCWRGRTATVAVDEPQSPARPATARSPLLQGFVVETLNPTTALFFVALLPQFVDPARADPRITIVVLGLVVTAIALSVDLLVVLAASTIAGAARRQHGAMQQARSLVGLLLIALAAFVAIR